MWVVTWCIISTIQIPCPEKSYVDKFGIKHDPAATCLVYHCKIEYDCTHEKQFMNRDSAKMFLKEISDESKRTSVLARIQIDSILLGQEKYIKYEDKDR